MWFSPDSDAIGNTVTGRLMGLIDTGTLGWLIGGGSSTNFVPVQPAYLTADGTSVSSGSMWVDATQIQLTVNAYNPTIAIPSDFPFGTLGWTVTITGLSVAGQNLTNVSLYLLPQVYDPSLNVPPLSYRTSNNPCNVLAG
jgi:hypothetical protein